MNITHPLGFAIGFLIGVVIVIGLVRLLSSKRKYLTSKDPCSDSSADLSYNQYVYVGDLFPQSSSRGGAFDAIPINSQEINNPNRPAPSGSAPILRKVGENVEHLGGNSPWRLEYEGKLYQHHTTRWDGDQFVVVFAPVNNNPDRNEGGNNNEQK